MGYRKDLIVIILVGFVFSLLLVAVSAIEPNGGSVTSGTPGTAPADAAGTAVAYAGNVTELTIVGYSTTQTWQGYFGNVSGAIQLADSNDNVIYNWTQANPAGEVYSSINSSITWANIQCFNFTANGSYADESGSGGTTNLEGVNLSVLENQFNIVGDDVDGVNETFSDGSNHDAFTTANQQFSVGECLETLIYDSTGVGVNNSFEEVLLYEPSTTSIVFASILDNSASGFDSASHDFEMLVLEDGHGVDVSTTTYNFFVELE